MKYYKYSYSMVSAKNWGVGGYIMTHLPPPRRKACYIDGFTVYCPYPRIQTPTYDYYSSNRQLTNMTRSISCKASFLNRLSYQLVTDIFKTLAFILSFIYKHTYIKRDDN